MNTVRFIPIVLALVACGCGRSELDGPFGTQSVYVAGAPDAGTGALPDLGGHGGAGSPGAGGRSGAAGSAGNGTMGGFGGAALRFCKTDLDCGAGVPRCCPVGTVMVCEPGPCVTADDEDGDNDGDHDHENGHGGR